MMKVEFSRWVVAFIQIFFIYSLITVVHWIFPGRYVRGYVSDGPKFYHLNGFRVFLLITSTFIFIVDFLHLIDPIELIQLRFQHAVAACFFGLIFTGIFVFPFPSNTNSLFNDFYAGRLKNPQLFSNRVDTKILLYLIGGILLEFNLILFEIEHRSEQNSSSSFILTNVRLYVFLFSFFLLEYFYHEHVHLYTFDFLVEFVGFKLIWGCLVFYPFFYPIAIWSSVKTNSLTSIRLLSSFVVFLSGWILSRGANNQKYLFRTKPKEKFLGFIEPKSINGRLLCSGWWKYARHINYLGDTLMAVGLTLALNDDTQWIHWLYPLYYVALFLARERTDFQRCEQKYGNDWTEYCRRVPYRILPGIY